ncbi:hypothetical protein F25303_11765 [Fusarium sp. NRRL 25303]|nr:hypothetical protein F25303_11765 [Fusarium sp. NRRL 25303]
MYCIQSSPAGSASVTSVMRWASLFEHLLRYTTIKQQPCFGIIPNSTDSSRFSLRHGFMGALVEYMRLTTSFTGGRDTESCYTTMMSSTTCYPLTTVHLQGSFPSQHMVGRHSSVPAQRIFRRAFPEDPIPRRLDARYSDQETRRQKTSQIFPELKTRKACLHDGCEDPRLLLKPSLLSMSQIHQAMLVGLHNFPIKQSGNCDGNAMRLKADMHNERQLFRDLGG